MPPRLLFETSDHPEHSCKLQIHGWAWSPWDGERWRKDCCTKREVGHQTGNHVCTLTEQPLNHELRALLLKSSVFTKKKVHLALLQGECGAGSISSQPTSCRHACCTIPRCCLTTGKWIHEKWTRRAWCETRSILPASKGCLC